MENIFVNITQSIDFKSSCSEDYSDFYQLHVLDYSKVVSTYYKKSVVDLKQLRSNLQTLFNGIKKRSEYVSGVTMYEKDGIFLITDSDAVISDIELSEFNMDEGQFDIISGIDLFDMLQEQPVDTFIKNALTTVGAAALIEVVEPFLSTLRSEQIRIDKMMQDWRDEDKISPKYLVEIYKIEHNYKPVKTHEFKCASVCSAESLPEIRLLTYADERTVAIIKEIATGKVIEEGLAEFIEHLKYNKWAKKHPAVMDMGDMMRMDLDSDDPNFLNWDDYVANDDLTEEGDEESEPRD